MTDDKRRHPAPPSFKNKYIAMQKSLNYYKKKCAVLRMENDRLKKLELLDNKIDEMFKSNKQSADFFRSQMFQLTRKKQGRRWSDADKQMAITLYHTSPKCYRILSKRADKPQRHIIFFNQI